MNVLEGEGTIIMSNLKPQNWYRLGISAEKQFLQDLSRYHGLVIPAHVAALYLKSVSQFLTRLRKPFFIDPMTYMLARPPRSIWNSEGNVRRSFVKLRYHYGPLMASAIGSRQLTPDFINEISESGTRAGPELVRHVLQFQVSVSATQRSLERIRSVIGEPVSQPIQPEFLVPPYFFFKSTNDPWYNTNLELLSTATQVASEYELPIFPIVCMSKNLLVQEEMLQLVFEQYSGHDGVILWINSLNEQSITSEEGRGLVELIRAFKSSKMTVYNLYGGYLSALLIHKGLDGFSCSVAYGESKKIDAPTGGGGRPIRYYEPRLHTMIRPIDAMNFYRDPASLRLLTHQCPFCQELRKCINQASSTAEKRNCVTEFFNIDRKPIPDEALNWRTSREHFMETRASEMNEISSSSIKQLSQSLQQAYKSYTHSDFSNISPVDINYLKVWQEIIS